MKKLLSLTLAVLFSASFAFSQGISLGLRGGLTLTSGNTTLPAMPGVLEVKNDANGQGPGYTFGITSRVKLGGFFLQGEINYSQFLLKQKASDNPFELSGQVSQAVSAQLGTTVNLPAGTVLGTLNVTSESTLRAINIPIMFGKTFAKGLVRAYLGPSFIFVTSAEQKTNGNLTNEATSLNIPGVPVAIPVAAGNTAIDRTQDLLTEEAGVVEVKPLIIAVEIGAGLSLPMGLDVDLRYGVPAITGVYKNSDVSGFLGILSLSVGYRLVKLGL